MLQTLLASLVIHSVPAAPILAPHADTLDFSLSAEPVLTIGSTDGDAEQWGRVAGVLRLPSGNIVVADEMNHRLGLYDGSGRHIASAGREGEGPGEFRIVMPPMHCGGDSIQVWDPALDRLTVFAPDLSESRTRSAAGLRAGSVSGPFPPRPSWMGCTPGGVYVTKVRSIDIPPPEPGPVSTLARIDVASESGVTASVGPLVGDERYFLGSSLGPRPLGRTTLVALGRDRIYIGTGEDFSVDVYSSEGVPMGSIQDGVARRRITDSMIAALDGPDAAEYPEFLPAYADLKVDPEGRLWIQEYPAPTDERVTWRAYDPDGTPVGRLHLPAELDVHQFGTDFVLGVEHDALGLATVVMYGVTWAESRHLRRPLQESPAVR